MSRLSNLIHEEEDPFGPGTDLIVSLVAFLLLILSAAAILYQRAVTEHRIDTGALKSMTADNVSLREQVDRLTQDVTRLTRAQSAYIVFKDAKDHQFESGKAKLTPDLRKFIDDTVVPQIDQNAESLGVDTIVVIGHTDGQNIRNTSNVDSYLHHVADMQTAPDSLIPGSNVDLGMMRSLAVIAELRHIQRSGRGLKRIRSTDGFRPYSAGPFLSTNGGWAPQDETNDLQRRRIEIRFLKGE